MDAQYLDLAERVAGISRDLTGDADDLVLDHAEVSSGLLVLSLAWKGAKLTLHMPGDATHEEVVVHLAFEFQDFAVEDDWGAPHPPCLAGHVHPASARLVDSTAVWVCPSSEAFVAEIG